MLARNSIDKTPMYGPDIDISEYIPKEDVGDIDIESIGNILERVGIDVKERNRAASYYQIESSVLRTVALQPGIEIMSLEEALDRYGQDLEEY